MKHDDLQQSLYDNFDASQWARFQKLNTGPKGMEDFGEIDFLAMRFSYSKPEIRAYEVKVSQADFDGDVKSQKFHKYLPYCDRFYFAIEKGIKWKDRIGHLPEVGVIIHGEKGWRVAKTPIPNTKREETIPEHFFMSIIFNKLEKESPCMHAKRALEWEIAHYKNDLSKLRYVANKFLKKEAVRLDALKKRAEMTMEQARIEVFKDIGVRLGVNAYNIETVDKLIERVFYDPLLGKLREHFTEAKANIRKVIGDHLNENRND